MVWRQLGVWKFRKILFEGLKYALGSIHPLWVRIGGVWALQAWIGVVLDVLFFGFRRCKFSLVPRGVGTSHQVGNCATAATGVSTCWKRGFQSAGGR